MARPFSITLIGGLRAGGRIRIGESLTRVPVIGGLDLDLGEAEFAPSGRGLALLGRAKVRQSGVARGI